MKKFELELKNEKQEMYKRLTLIILFINFVFFVYGASISIEPDQKKWFVFGAVVILINVVINWYRTRRTPAIQDAYTSNYIAVSFAWVILKNYWVAVVHLILLILFLKASRPQIIQFTTSEISIQGWPEKKIQWDSVSNIILKDGILTIDYKSNKLMQCKVVENWSTVEEQVFNQFCYDQIHNNVYTPS